MKSETHASYEERILRVQLHIQTHLFDELPLAELARIACFSPYHFHRIFRGMVGETLAGHIRRLRLERAAQLLAQKNRGITDLAFDCGYETVESFTRAFKERFGCPPSKYKDPPQGSAIEQRLAEMNPGDIKMKVEIKEFPEHRVAFVRHIGPYAECGAAWEKLCRWAAPRGWLGGGSEFIGLCHDDPDVTPAENIRYDACIPVGGDVQPEGNIGVQTIPGGLYAMATHHGSYSRLSETYAWLCGRWAPQSGYEIRSMSSIEIYLNSPDDTPEDELLTDVHIPIEKR